MIEIRFGESTWREIERWARDKLETERQRNDNPALDAAQTALCRGRISAFRELLALPAQRAAQVQQDEPS